MASASSEKRFRTLLQRYLENKVSEAEKQFVETYMAYFDTLKEDGASLDDAAWLHLEDGMLEKMHSVMKESERRKPVSYRLPFNRSRIVRFAAAAVLAALICGGYLLWFKKAEKSGAHPIARLTTDASPGGNKAILTLSGGQQILLDSAHLGALVQEGSANITKTDSGKLTYNMTDKKPSEVLYNTLATPRGGQYKLTLPDGTHVWLNAASSLRYPVSFAGSKQREVSLTGEAYFEVAHDSHQPFHVKVGSQVIEDIGTAFNINAYEDEQDVKTTLLEGSVRVTAVASGPVVGVNTDKTRLTVVLKPGQQAQMLASANSESGKVSPIKVINKVDTDEVMAWKNGFFDFDHVGLGELMRELSRWYDVDVVYEGGKAPDFRFGGAMGRDLNLSQVLSGLQQARVHFRIEGKKLIVMP